MNTYEYKSVRLTYLKYMNQIHVTTQKHYKIFTHVYQQTVHSGIDIESIPYFSLINN